MSSTFDSSRNSGLLARDPSFAWWIGALVVLYMVFVAARHRHAEAPVASPAPAAVVTPAPAPSEGASAAPTEAKPAN